MLVWCGQENLVLEKLDIGWNKLSLRVMESIKHGLENQRALKSLVMDHCGICDQGGAFVFASMIENKTLERLHMNANALSTSTCFMLASCIEGPYVNPQLRPSTQSRHTHSCVSVRDALPPA
jgi:Ran GTPase-activating protein (RanGAP) involved in mRNA processing and transport